MIEIKQSLHHEAELNLDLETAEDGGLNARGAEAAVAKEREWQEALLAEWCAELATINEAYRLMKREQDGSNLPLVTSMDRSDFETKLVTVHELSLLHNYIKDSDIIAGARYEMPSGAVERRNDLLMAIAENNDLDRFFYSLDKRSRERLCFGVQF